MNAIEELKAENTRLLEELEISYKNMEMILEQSSQEKEIAYRELEYKVQTLEHLYSELSNKENMLVHMEKLSSIGQFIAEIIHELNNPLTVISGTIDLLLIGELPDKVRRKLEIIPKNVIRMTNILQRFRSMAYKGEEEFQQFDFNNNLLDCLETIELIKPKMNKIKVNICPKPIKVFGDPYQINQIFLNLAKNAFDAMKDHGQYLTVTSRKVSKDCFTVSGEFSDVFCQERDAWEKIIDKTDSFALVEFNDEGTGIPENIINNIFQEFYTTKGREKGTGLGLSISSDIAKRHNGNLAVKSVIGNGTTFQLVIPISK